MFLKIHKTFKTGLTVFIMLINVFVCLFDLIL